MGQADRQSNGCKQAGSPTGADRLLNHKGQVGSQSKGCKQATQLYFATATASVQMCADGLFGEVKGLFDQSPSIVESEFSRACCDDFATQFAGKIGHIC